MMNSSHEVCQLNFFLGIKSANRVILLTYPNTKLLVFRLPNVNIQIFEHLSNIHEMIQSFIQNPVKHLR